MNSAEKIEIQKIAKDFVRALNREDLKTVRELGSKLHNLSCNSVRPWTQTLMYEVMSPIVTKLARGHWAGVSAWFVMQKSANEQMDLWIKRICA